MVDQKLIDDAIKMFECCSQAGRCDECPVGAESCLRAAPELGLKVVKGLLEERDHYMLTLEGVMHFVDKWLDTPDELRMTEVIRAAAMRDKTLRIVEKLLAEKSDAYRIMQERLLKESFPEDGIGCDCVYVSDINRIAEELVEERDG